MRINRKDFERLCAIARELNEKEEMEMWQELEDIIENIEKESNKFVGGW
mgnify:CR=1 FL=1